MVKVEYTCPLISSIDLMDILSELMIKSTNKVVVTFNNPPAAIFIEDPTVSLELNPINLNCPASEVKTADETSGSFGS